MALRPCRECGVQVSTAAKRCPHCGIKLPSVASWSERKHPVLSAAFFLFVVAGVVLAIRASQHVAEGESGATASTAREIPGCSGTATMNLAKEAIEGAPIAKIINITVFNVQNGREIKYDFNAKKRWCQATALMNSGKHEVQFSLEWADEKSNRIWLQVDDLGN